MAKGVFITGTDTGVGKTVVSAVIIRSLIRKGFRTGAMKPLETDARNRTTCSARKTALSSGPSAGMDDPLELVTLSGTNCLCADGRLGPRKKSRRPVRGVLSLSHSFGKYDAVVVEGVGGILVPLTRPTAGAPAYYVSDLIRSLALPVVIVTRPTLGTINHTLLTVYQALREGLDVIGIIINEHAPPGQSVAGEDESHDHREAQPRAGPRHSCPTFPRLPWMPWMPSPPGRPSSSIPSFRPALPNPMDGRL
ncbi:MAG: dethiobiotin synthase [Desulfomicrobium escambiense]|nr:dethiobiotin synthase [Desulfomicrobium escambiense]